jgi:AcrR family transcriptional regulator
MSAIASAAGTSIDTVYELVGRKPVLLRELIEQALSGTDHAVVGEERSHVIAMRAETDPAVKLAIYAQAITETHRRLAPLFLALHDASSTEVEARGVWEEISRRRAANMRKLALDLRSTGRLRSDLTDADVADIIWATNSPEVYVLLTHDRGWSPDRYQDWLADGWRRLLLE